MTSSRVRRRWLSLAATAAVFALVLGALALRGPSPDAPPARAAVSPMGEHAWPMVGGSNSRDLVNLFDTNIPTNWSVKAGAEKNVKWVVPLGSKAYGGPIVAGGKIFIGTNNDVPRDPKITGDKGILMCFRESDGKFLWQAVHDKLEKGRVNDWPREGICSSPVVKGNRLYYVNNRCQVVCADVEGDQEKQEAKILWTID